MRLKPERFGQQKEKPSKKPYQHRPQTASTRLLGPILIGQKRLLGTPYLPRNSKMLNQGFPRQSTVGRPRSLWLGSVAGLCGPALCPGLVLFLSLSCPCLGRAPDSVAGSCPPVLLLWSCCFPPLVLADQPWTPCLSWPGSGLVLLFVFSCPALLLSSLVAEKKNWPHSLAAPPKSVAGLCGRATEPSHGVQGRGQ